MKMFTRENLKMTKHTDLVNIPKRVVKYMKDNGNMISPTERENKNLKMVQYMKVNLEMEQNMVMDNINGLINLTIQEVGRIMSLTERVNTPGVMEENI